MLGQICDELAKPNGQRNVLALLARNRCSTLRYAPPTTSSGKGYWVSHLKDAADGLLPVYDKMADLADLPPSEIAKAQDELMSEKNLSGPARRLGLMILPAIASARQAEATHQMRATMLAVALAVLQDGPPILSEESRCGPFAHAPFEYEGTETGFRLVSQAIAKNGKCVSLTVGHVTPKRGAK